MTTTEHSLFPPRHLFVSKASLLGVKEVGRASCSPQLTVVKAHGFPPAQLIVRCISQRTALRAASLYAQKNVWGKLRPHTATTAFLTEEQS